MNAIENTSNVQCWHMKQSLLFDKWVDTMKRATLLERYTHTTHQRTWSTPNADNC